MPTSGHMPYDRLSSASQGGAKFCEYFLKTISGCVNPFSTTHAIEKLPNPIQSLISELLIDVIPYTDTAIRPMTYILMIFITVSVNVR